MCKPTSGLWTETHGASRSIDLERQEACKPLNELFKQCVSVQAECALEGILDISLYRFLETSATLNGLKCHLSTDTFKSVFKSMQKKKEAGCVMDVCVKNL